MPQMKTAQHGFWYHFLDILFNIAVIIAIVAAIRTFLVSPFQVEGSSMENTLLDKEYIVINKLAYYIGKPQRGDIVVLRPPSDPGKYYVKRVIGTPGDEVIIQDGYVYIRKAGENQIRKLNEDGYLSKENDGQTFRVDPQHLPSSGDRTPITYDVPPGEYLVLGDNRKGSLDSRGFTDENGKPIPYVPQNEIKGRVWFVALPLSKIHVLEPPDYGF